MDDVEKGALLRVQNYEKNLQDKTWLEQAQNPCAAQDDKLSQNLKQNQSEKNNMYV